MSLAPPTDIVLEVARAADPNRAAAVASKLNALALGGAATPRDFTTALDKAQVTAARSAPSRPPPAPISRAAKAERQLESVLLNQFIGEMLPKDAPDAFGQGFSGDMWRSMLAERVADQIAASGRLGIAQRLFSNHPLGGRAPPLSAERAAGPTQTAQASANPLSSASGADIENGAFLFARTATP